MSKYAIKYQLGTLAVGSHRSLSRALAHLRRCERAAQRGGDCQELRIIHKDGSALDCAEAEELQDCINAESV